MGEVSAADAGDIATRLNLPRASGRIVRAWPEVQRSLVRSTAKSAEGLAAVVERLDGDSLLAAAAGAPPGARSRIAAVSRSLRGARLQIGGRDLVAAGVPAGPAIGRALSATRTARRNGAIRREDELAFALKAARS
jgi:hypothetical protein